MKNKLTISVIVSASLLIPLLLAGQTRDPKSSERSFQQGKELYKSGSYANAIQAFTLALSSNPENLEVYIERAKAYEKLDSIDLAIDDYRYYSVTAKKPSYEVYYSLARLNNKIFNYKDAISDATKAIDEKKNHLPSYYEKYAAQMATKYYNDALTTGQNALEIDKSDTNYFNVGKAYYYLKSYENAKARIDEAIKKNYNYEEAYIYKAMTLLELNELGTAYQTINTAIGKNNNCKQCLIVRSRVLHNQNNIIPAIDDLSTVIKRHSNDQDIDEIIFTRGLYREEIKQPLEGIADFTEVLRLNPEFILAYYHRGILYEYIDKKQNAINDFESYINNIKYIKLSDPLIMEDCKTRIYELNKEETDPVIEIYEPIQRLQSTLDVEKTMKDFKIRGKIIEDNEVVSVKIGGTELNIDNKLMKEKNEFESDYLSSSLEEISIEVTDIYNNTTLNTYKLRRTETDPPIINMLKPYSDGDNLYIEGDPPTIMLEGNVNDENLIKSFKLDSISNICYDPSEFNPLWWGGIEISNKNSITISVEDYFGNLTVKRYNLLRNMTPQNENNPMGNTWALLFANSNYNYYESLDGPKTDAMQIQKTLKNDFNFQNVIIQNDLSKSDFEKYFQVDLRRIIEYYKIKSLLIWYAGHGIFENNESYWLPVDAQNNTVTSYFSTTALKSYMEPYAKDIAHLLLVSDACNSGSSFYELYRESPKNMSCNNINLMSLKSYQVLTSSKSDQVSSDHSKFVEVFLEVLEKDNSSCISVNKIYEELKNEFGDQSIQTPQLGAIKGMNDQNGTFFFIKQENNDK